MLWLLLGSYEVFSSYIDVLEHWASCAGHAHYIDISKIIPMQAIWPFMA